MSISRRNASKSSQGIASGLAEQRRLPRVPVRTVSRGQVQLEVIAPKRSGSQRHAVTIVEICRVTHQPTAAPSGGAGLALEYELHLGDSTGLLKVVSRDPARTVRLADPGELHGDWSSWFDRCVFEDSSRRLAEEPKEREESERAVDL